MARSGRGSGRTVDSGGLPHDQVPVLALNFERKGKEWQTGKATINIVTKQKQYQTSLGKKKTFCELTRIHSRAVPVILFSSMPAPYSPTHEGSEDQARDESWRQSAEIPHRTSPHNEAHNVPLVMTAGILVSGWWQRWKSPFLCISAGIDN